MRTKITPVTKQRQYLGCNPQNHQQPDRKTLILTASSLLITTPAMASWDSPKVQDETAYEMREVSLRMVRFCEADRLNI